MFLVPFCENPDYSKQLTEDAVVEFFVQPDVPVAQGGGASSKREPYVELELHSARCTKDLFKRLVAVSIRCTVAQYALSLNASRVGHRSKF